MHRYQTISRLRYNTKPSGSESQQRWRWREVKPAVCRQQQQFAAVIRFSTFHICIQIQKLQMAIEPFLNQYVICWLGEGPYTSWPLAVWYIALYWKQCNEHHLSFLLQYRLSYAENPSLFCGGEAVLMYKLIPLALFFYDTLSLMFTFFWKECGMLEVHVMLT